MCNPGYVEVVAGAAPSKDAVAAAVSGLSVDLEQRGAVSRPEFSIRVARRAARRLVELQEAESVAQSVLLVLALDGFQLAADARR